MIECNTTVSIEKGYLAIKVDSFELDSDNKVLNLFNSNVHIGALPLDLAELKFIKAKTIENAPSFIKNNQIKFYEVVEKENL